MRDGEQYVWVCGAEETTELQEMRDRHFAKGILEAALCMMICGLSYMCPLQFNNVWRTRCISRIAKAALYYIIITE